MLEERMRGFDVVAEEATRTSKRMDAMEGTVHRVAGTLEGFLSRIQIDDRLRLVPDTRRISPGHLAIDCPPSPSTPLELPMAEDDADLDIGSPSVHDTCTTPSDLDAGSRMLDAGPIASGSGTSPTPSQPPEPAPLPTPIAVPAPEPAPAPTVQVIPATPQGSQNLAIATPAPAVPPPIPSPPPTTVAEVDSLPPPRTRNRSRTPAATLLGVPERSRTRSGSRSKTPA
jgi:hypothetical protein